MNPATFVAPTRIKFRSFDGREIPAYYYRPRTASAKRKAPVLINIHGGPEGQYRPLFTGTTQFIVDELGMAVIHPNVRGSAGYGKTYLKLDNAELREDSVKDIGALLDWIARQPELDASRVAVTGGSYGGFMVLSSLVHFGDRIRAGIDIVGIANFITFLERTSAYRQDLRRAEYGDERKPEMRTVFERISPAAGASKIQVGAAGRAWPQRPARAVFGGGTDRGEGPCRRPACLDRLRRQRGARFREEGQPRLFGGGRGAFPERVSEIAATVSRRAARRTHAVRLLSGRTQRREKLAHFAGRVRVAGGSCRRNAIAQDRAGVGNPLKPRQLLRRHEESRDIRRLLGR